MLVVPDADDWQGAEVDALVTGGATRAASVRAGLAAVSPGAEVVVVHDAARPLATAALFDAVIAAVRDGADGAVPGLAVTDTLKRVDDVRVTATVDRVGLVAVQTPAGVPRRHPARRARERATTRPTTPRWSRRSAAPSWSSPAIPAT